MKLSVYLALIGAAHSSEVISEAEHEFLKFVSEYGRSYGTREEFGFRAALFAENYKHIQAHNAGNSTFKMGINKFAD